MTKFVALVDGSIYSQSVCDHAAWAATRAGASVELLHVLGRREPFGTPSDLSGAVGLGARTSLLEELAELDVARSKLAQKQGRAILDDATAILEKDGVTGVTTQLRIGDLVEEVAESEADADMVMVGKRGEAADFAKPHLGSNLERIVRSSVKPVFVASRAFKPIERFLIAYDGGASAMKAVDYVARSPIFAGLECHLLTVGAENSDAAKRLDDARAVLRGAGYEVRAKLVQGQAEAVIAREVEEAGIGLVVMGAYGHSRIRTLIIGSTTSEMLRACKVPVLLFR
ncbi:universal stress protein [Parvibaculum sp.]|uniref:universal stress protein n=1 Tax=Parvibaculum sp. TaxID=2024848 RepID=UPI000C942985|nr:universal stress protein [Parvibaculum sp.]MAB12681.1 universal stress protein UspA [Parvibaculum sp.]